MDYEALRGLIQADAALTALAAGGHDADIADALNTPTVAIVAPYQLTTLTVLAVLGPTRGTVVMAALRQASGFGEIVKLMDDRAAGVNLAHPDANEMFATLVTAGILAQPEADSILAMRDATVSRAVHALGQSVHHLDVARALEAT